MEDFMSSERLQLEKQIEVVEAAASMHAQLLSMHQAVSAASAGEMEARNRVALLTKEIESLTNEIQSLQIGLLELRDENSRQCRIFDNSLNEKELEIVNLKSNLQAFEGKDAKVVELLSGLKNISYGMENACVMDGGTQVCVVCKKTLKEIVTEVSQVSKDLEAVDELKDSAEQLGFVVESFLQEESDIAGDRNIGLSSMFGSNEVLDVAGRCTLMTKELKDEDRCFKIMQNFYLELQDKASKLQKAIEHLQETFLDLSPTVSMLFDAIAKVELEEGLACQLESIIHEVMEFCESVIRKDTNLLESELQQIECKQPDAKQAQDHAKKNVAYEDNIDVKSRFACGSTEFIGCPDGEVKVMQEVEDNCKVLRTMVGFHLELHKKDEELQRGMSHLQKMLVDFPPKVSMPFDAIDKLEQEKEILTVVLESVEHEVREFEKKEEEIGCVHYELQQAEGRREAEHAGKDEEEDSNQKFCEVGQSDLAIEMGVGGEKHSDICSRFIIGGEEVINKSDVFVQMTQEMENFYRQWPDKVKELQKIMDHLQETALHFPATVGITFAGINMLEQKNQNLSYQLDGFYDKVKEFCVAVEKKDEKMACLEQEIQQVNCKLREVEQARDDVCLLLNVEKGKCVEENRRLQKQMNSMLVHIAERDRLLNEELSITQSKVDHLETRIMDIGNYVDMLDSHERDVEHDKDLKKIVENACGHVMEKEREMEVLMKGLDGAYMRASQMQGKVNGLKAVLNKFSSAKEGWAQREREIHEHFERLSNIVSQKEMVIASLQLKNRDRENILRQSVESEDVLEEEVSILRAQLEIVEQQRVRDADSALKASLPLLDLLKAEEDRACLIMKLNEVQARLKHLRTDNNDLRCSIQKQDTAVLFDQVELEEAIVSLREAEYEMNEVMRERQMLVEAEEEASVELCSVLTELEKQQLQVWLKEEEIQAKGSYLQSLGSGCGNEGKLNAISGGVLETVEAKASNSKVLVRKFMECKKYVGEINQILQRLTDMKKLVPEDYKQQQQIIE